jgi:hypothetical protein
VVFVSDILSEKSLKQFILSKPFYISTMASTPSMA